MTTHSKTEPAWWYTPAATGAVLIVVSWITGWSAIPTRIAVLEKQQEQMATKTDIANLSGDVKALTANVQNLNTKGNQAGGRLGHTPVASWLLAVGTDELARVLLIDAKTGVVREFGKPPIADNNKTVQMAAIWGAAGGTDLLADPLDFLALTQTEPDSPIKSLWLSCSFALMVPADKMPLEVADRLLGPSKTEPHKVTPAPTTFEKLIDFLRANPDLLAT